MIETAKQQERAILVGVELQETEHFDMSMEELASLAKTSASTIALISSNFPEPTKDLLS